MMLFMSCLWKLWEEISVHLKVIFSSVCMCVCVCVCVCVCSTHSMLNTLISENPFVGLVSLPHICAFQG
jgi:hypothetical protein